MKFPKRLRHRGKGKVLATKREAAQWFQVKPARSAANVIPLSAVSGKEAH